MRRLGSSPAIRAGMPLSTLSTFLGAWCDRHGVFLDHESIEVRPVNKATGFGGNGVFAKKDLTVGEMVATIPATATLRRSDLYTYTVEEFQNQKSSSSSQTSSIPWYVDDGNCAIDRRPCSYFADTGGKEKFQDGLLSIQRGRVPKLLDPGNAHGATWMPFSDEERGWWELAVVVAEERRRALFHLKNRGNTTTRAASWEAPFDSYLLECLPQRKVIDYTSAFFHQRDLLMPRLPSDAVARLGRIGRDRSNIANFIAQLFTATGTDPTTVDDPDLCGACVLTSAELQWAIEIVISRANNFSLSVAHTGSAPRPYGFSEEMPPGAEPTLCPIFDLLNHGPRTNVLVADCLMQAPRKKRPSNQKDQTSLVPCMVIGVLGSVAEGAELCYAYNAPKRQDNARGVDEVECLARWGFLPHGME